MRAKNEITVDRLEFKGAVRWTSRGRRAAAEETLLYWTDSGFVVEAPLARTTIKSAGTWAGSVAVNAMLLKKLVPKLPRTRELTLIYVAGQLALGTVRISAREAR